MEQETSVGLLKQFKFCKDCRWHTLNSLGKHLCMHPQINEKMKVIELKKYIDANGSTKYDFLVSGLDFSVLAKSARMSENLCGENASKFEDLPY